MTRAAWINWIIRLVLCTLCLYAAFTAAGLTIAAVVRWQVVAWLNSR